MSLGIKLRNLFQLPTVLAAVCLVLAGTVATHAQTARLNGHVTDSTGAVVSGAEVKVVNTRPIRPNCCTPIRGQVRGGEPAA